jgi:4-amino-4-deoxy-L-arabinose transferase-like glycosyltransferase
MKRLKEHWYSIALILLLGWVLAASLFLAWHDSMTADEGVHVTSGYTYITRHDFRFDPDHPPLFKMLYALPVLTLHTHLPTTDQELWQKSAPTLYDTWHESSEWSDRWFYGSGNNAELMIFLARLPAVAIFCVLAWLVWKIGTEWFSRRIGLLALAIFAFNPTLLAHGHLANTDIPVATGFVATFYLLWRYGEKPSLKRLLVLSLVFALTMLTKFSALVLIPIIILYLLLQGWRNGMWRRYLRDLAILLLVTGTVIWIMYQGHSHFIGGEPYKFRGAERLATFALNHGTSLTKIIQVTSHILPLDYLKGVTLVIDNADLGRVAYLLGTHYYGGVWFYFPVLYVLKTQIVGLLLLIAGIILYIKSNPLRRQTPAQHLLLIATLLIIIISLRNKLNIGIRHIAPLLVLSSFPVAQALDWLFSKKKILIANLALGLYILPCLLTFPNLLSYTNAFVHPADHAWYYINESNIDWGQEAKQIRDVEKTTLHGIPIYANYMWSPRVLGYFGVPTKEFDPAHPPYNQVIMLTSGQLSEPEYARFRTETPITRIANTTYFYILQ